MWFSFIFIYLTSGCGADLDSSSDVEAMFDHVSTLEDKMNLICSYISSDSNFDLSAHVFHKDDFCSNIDKGIISLSSIQKEYEYGNPKYEEKDNIFKYGIILKIYTNSPIIELAQKATPVLKDLKQESNSSSKFVISQGKEDELKLDEATTSATAKFTISSTHHQTGTVNIKNTWKLYGIKGTGSYSDYFLITVDTIDQEGLIKDTSQIHDAHILVAILPHAGDIFINLMAQFNLFGAGATPNMGQELTQMVTDTLYDINQKIN